MRSLLKPFIAMLTLSTVLSYPARAGEATDQVALEQLLRHFLATVDAPTTHANFWADDLIYTSSSGSRFGKDQIMSGFDEPSDEGAEPGPTYGAENVTIRLLGDHAVVTFKLTADMAGGEQAAYFNTGVFRRNGDTWQAFTWQATRIPESD